MPNPAVVSRLASTRVALVGEAEAKVLAAKYLALEKNKSVYLAELQRDMTQLLYGNLKDFQMPQNVIMGGAGDGKPAAARATPVRLPAGSD